MLDLSKAALPLVIEIWLGSPRATWAPERAAAIQSLIATAKLNGIDPAKWLTETLAKLPTHPNSRIDELLPLRR